MRTVITFMLSHLFHPIVAKKSKFCLIIITMMIIMIAIIMITIIMITKIMMILITYRMKSIKRLS